MNTIKDIVQEHIQGRKQIIKLAKSDLIRTYRGSALGWLWAFVKPIVSIFVYWFAYEIGLRSGKPRGGYPAFFWLIAGLIPWFYMSEMITQGLDSIRKYKFLVTKMKFPVSTIPTFTSIAKVFVHLILLSIMIIIFAAAGYYPDIYYLQLPFYIICMFTFFTVFTLFTSTLASMSKDFGNLVKSFITAIFWFSGILYDVNTVQNIWIRRILRCNPVTFICDGFRNVFIYKTWFFDEPKRLLYFVIILMFMTVLAFFTYGRLKKDIPDVL